ncbi:MAG: hypothetical protein IKO00_05540 [Oscillospiraceae bacterium]|nr:hypothetical protein [Oscillospiraceae bacterium]
MYKIVVNKIRCKFCGDVIESRSVHDFVQCRCGKCSTDGGQEYAQRSFITDNPEDTYEDCSTYLNTETGKLVTAKDMKQEDIPTEKAADDAIWEPFGEVEEPKKNEDGTIRYPHAGAVEIPEVVADTSDEPKVTEEQSDEPEKPFVNTPKWGKSKYAIKDGKLNEEGKKRYFEPDSAE